MCDWERCDKPDKLREPFHLDTIDSLHNPNMVSYGEITQGWGGGVGGLMSAAGFPS